MKVKSICLAGLFLLSGMIFAQQKYDCKDYYLGIGPDKHVKVEVLNAGTVPEFKMEVVKYSQDAQGNLSVNASCYFGGMPGDQYKGRGVALPAGAKCRISFEYQGDIPYFWMTPVEFYGPRFWSDRTKLMPEKKNRYFAPDKTKWQKTEQIVTLSGKAKRLGVYANFYVNEKDGNLKVKPGQFVKIRNVSISQIK